MPDSKGRNRIYLDVAPETYEKAYRLIPWGWRNPLMQIVIDQLLEAIEKEGLAVAALIMDGKLGLFGKE
jgi:hypothetical protein